MPRHKGATHVIAGMTQAKAAELLNCSTSHISRMARGGKIRTLDDGSIDPTDPQIVAASKGKVPQQKGDVIDYYRERARVESLKAKKLEFDLDVAQGRYVEAKSVEDSMVALGCMIREESENAIERLSARLASRFGIDEHTVRVMVEAELFEGAEKFCDEIEGMVEG